MLGVGSCAPAAVHLTQKTTEPILAFSELLSCESLASIKADNRRAEHKRAFERPPIRRSRRLEVQTRSQRKLGSDPSSTLITAVRHTTQYQLNAAQQDQADCLGQNVRLSGVAKLEISYTSAFLAALLSVCPCRSRRPLLPEQAQRGRQPTKLAPWPTMR